MPTRPKLETSPVAGLDSTTNYAKPAPGKVFASNNMLYERGMAMNRPGLTTVALGGIVGPLTYGHNIVAQTTNYNILINSANTIYYFPGIAIAPAAGAAAFGSAQFHNISAIIGYVVFGNNPGGIVIWNPTGGTYTVTAAGAYRYFTGHKGRAVAAYRIAGGSTLTNARTFAWSSPGTLTTWTSADGSAGELAIADAEDELTGIGVLHNTVVLLRSQGIHLAVETGNLPLPYNVQAFSPTGAGCLYPSTAAWNDQQVMYVGQDDVYSFDLQNITSVGYEIRQTLIASCQAGVIYNGFFTRNILNGVVRWRYHLTPVNSPSSNHYVYDMLERAWSTHTYTTNFKWGWNFAPTAGVNEYGVGLVDGSNPPNLKLWDASVACEASASFAMYFEGPQDLDYKIVDALIRVKDLTGAVPTGPASITLELASILNQTRTVLTSTTITPGTGAALNKWIRAWFRSTNGVIGVGNSFEAKITVAAGAPFQCDYFALFPEETGGYRGA